MIDADNQAMNLQELQLSLEQSDQQNRTGHEAAALLGLTYQDFAKKILDAGLLQRKRRYSFAELLPLAERKSLTVAAGELTVVRTGGKTAYRPGAERPYLGVHTEFDDETLNANCLGWWRGDPERIVRNQLMVVTIGQIPFAVYLILGVAESRGEGALRRHRFEGRLLARLKARPTMTENDIEISTGILGMEHRDQSWLRAADAEKPPYAVVTSVDNLVYPHSPEAAAEDPEQVREAMKRACHLTPVIMGARVSATSGGPVAYLPAGDEDN